MPVTYTLTGVDASTWGFANPVTVSPETPLRLVEPPAGIAGVGPKHDDDRNVDQAGVTWRAAMFEPNMIGLKLHFGPVPKGDAALVRFMELSDAIGDGAKVGRFTVAGPRRTTFQEVRLAGPRLHVPTDQLLNVGAVLGFEVALRSDESWWRMAPFDQTVTAAALPTILFDNDSEDDEWPYLELTGPMTSPAVGLYGETVTLPTIGSGQTWKIDTDPNHFHITDHLGVDRTFFGGVSAPGRWYTRALAGDDDVPLTVSTSGTSGVTRVRLVVARKFRSAL